MSHFYLSIVLSDAKHSLSYKSERVCFKLVQRLSPLVYTATRNVKSILVLMIFNEGTYFEWFRNKHGTYCVCRLYREVYLLCMWTVP